MKEMFITKDRHTMKAIAIVGLAMLATHVTWASAEELVSGPQAGEKVSGYFDFAGTKCGGSTDRYPVGTKSLRYY